jgi:hypothetical protein
MVQRNILQQKIILVLLNNFSVKLTKYRVSKLAGTTTTRVFQVIKKLESLKLVNNTNVIDYEGLLNYYIKLDKTKYKKYYFQLSDPLSFFENKKIDYALTTYSAENLVNHYLFLNKYQIYLTKEGYNSVEKEIKSKGFIGGGNLILMIPNNDLVFYNPQKIRNYKLVSIPQLLIDLKKEGGACIEAYSQILDKYVFQKRN